MLNLKKKRGVTWHNHGCGERLCCDNIVECQPAKSNDIFYEIFQIFHDAKTNLTWQMVFVSSILQQLTYRKQNGDESYNTTPFHRQIYCNYFIVDRLVPPLCYFNLKIQRWVCLAAAHHPSRNTGGKQQHPDGNKFLITPAAIGCKKE